MSLKEGRETLYWLRLLAYACPDRSERVKRLYAECDQIVAILVTSIKTKRANQAARKLAKKRKPFLFEVPD